MSFSGEQSYLKLLNGNTDEQAIGLKPKKLKVNRVFISYQMVTHESTN